MKRYLLLFGMLFMCLGVNINAEYVDNETPTMEQYESDYIEDNTPKLRSALTRGALTIPTEGVYDTIKDAHNAAGVMTARSFYYKSKLVEKRTYTQTGSTDCRMKNKYLYYSNGSTVYTHRTYSNTGATCYNLQTKTYNTASKIQAHLIYEGKINGKVKERRDYEATGTYYTAKSYYKNGVITSKEYWKGASGNYILEYGLFNAAGKNWTKLTRYYNSAKDISEIINYAGVEPNIRKNTTLYDIDGNKTTYLTYDAKGDVFQKNLYDEDGYLTKEIRYHAGTGIWNWEAIYQAGNNKKDVVTYRDLSNKIIRQLRYFLDGTHLRWDINYVNAEKESVQLYDKSSYANIGKYVYTPEDKLLEQQLRAEYSDFEDGAVYENVFDSGIVTYLNQTLDFSGSQTVYIEDFKTFKHLEIILPEVVESEEVEADNTIEEDFESDEYENDISSLNGFKYFTELEDIKIMNASISEIGLELKELKHLERIDLSNNGIDTISTDNVFPTNLIYLELKNNNLETTDFITSDLVKLEYVGLENNEIEFISNNLYLLNKNNRLDKVIMNPKNISETITDITDYNLLADNNLIVDEKNDSVIKFKINKDVNVFLKDQKVNIDNFVLNNLYVGLGQSYGNAFTSGSYLGYLGSDKEVKLYNEVDVEKLNLYNESFDNTKTELQFNNNEVIKDNYFDKEGTYLIKVNSSYKNINFEGEIYVRVLDDNESSYIEALENETGELPLDGEDISNLDKIEDSETIVNDETETVIDENGNQLSEESLLEFDSESKSMEELEVKTEKEVEHFKDLNTETNPLLRGRVPKGKNYGKYSKKAGDILINNGKALGIFKTGHSAIVDGQGYWKIESNFDAKNENKNGVRRLNGKWYAKGKDIFMTRPIGTTAADRKKARDWAYKQIGKPYSFDYLRPNLTYKMYCSQLVYLSYLKTKKLNLNTKSNTYTVRKCTGYGTGKIKCKTYKYNAIHPGELITGPKTKVIYVSRK